jgi:hypothetical protein
MITKRVRHVPVADSTDAELYPSRCLTCRGIYNQNPWAPDRKDFCESCGSQDATTTMATFSPLGLRVGPLRGLSIQDRSKSYSLKH